VALLDRLHLSHTGNIPSLDGATAWLNSEPLTTADVEGRVVLFDFWTFTCINWIRTAPYRRAWDERYREHGLTIVGVHTPEFPFERDLDSIRAAIEERQIEYPVAVDSEYGVWDAFANRYWPALYFVDRAGTIRYQHFGEGRYEDSERMIRELLDLPADDVLVLETEGIEAQADWDSLASPETYLGAERGERFASPGGGTRDERRSYAAPSSLGFNLWSLAGEWTIGSTATTLHEAGGALAYRFRARDVNLVMGPGQGVAPIPFRVSVDGAPPGAAHGVDVDGGGEGVAADRRLFQLVRQPERVDEHTFEITFLEPGVEVYAFTFG
jgi:thiol-disulfide isomerase/thioredoxin